MNRMMSNTSSMSSDSNLSISSSTPATEQVPARRNSIPGIKMPMWGNTRSLSSPATAKTGKDIFTFVVTPDRVPQFIIPPLDIQEDQRFFNKERAAGWQQQKQQHICFSQEDNYTSRIAPSSSLDCPQRRAGEPAEAARIPLPRAMGHPERTHSPALSPNGHPRSSHKGCAVPASPVQDHNPLRLPNPGGEPASDQPRGSVLPGARPPAVWGGRGQGRGVGAQEEPRGARGRMLFTRPEKQQQSGQVDPRRAVGGEAQEGGSQTQQVLWHRQERLVKGSPDTEIEEEASESQPPTPQNPDRDGGSSQDPSPPQRRSRKISFRGFSRSTLPA